MQHAVEPATRRLAGVLHSLLSEPQLDRLLESVADSIGALVAVDELVIFRASPAERHLTPILVRSEWSDEVFALQVPYGFGITGWAAEQRLPVCANDAHADERCEQVPGTPNLPESLMVIPLVAHGAVKGTLNLSRNRRLHDENAFSDEEFELAQIFADLAAIALDNAESRATLETLARVDDLTELPNRRYFREEVERQTAAAKRTHEQLTLFWIDVDNFKQVNDRHGHDAGDTVLHAIGSAVKAAVRDTDLVARVGGDEFAIVLPGIAPADAKRAAGAVTEAIRGLQVGFGAETVRVSASLGIANLTSDDTAADLISRADLAMYERKREHNASPVAALRA